MYCRAHVTLDYSGYVCVCVSVAEDWIQFVILVTPVSITLTTQTEMLTENDRTWNIVLLLKQQNSNT